MCREIEGAGLNFRSQFRLSGHGVRLQHAIVRLERGSATSGYVKYGDSCS